MPASMPCELREKLAELVRERPDATQGQIVKIFQARTGRKISPSTAHYAISRWRTGGPKDYHLDSESKRIVKELIELSAPLYSWKEVAEDFGRMTGRRISPRTVASIAYGQMGVKPIGGRASYRFGVRDKDAGDKLELGTQTKLANAPYRPGYFPKCYRGPDGGSGGDRVRVYRTGGAEKGRG